MRIFDSTVGKTDCFDREGMICKNVRCFGDDVIEDLITHQKSREDRSIITMMMKDDRG